MFIPSKKVSLLEYANQFFPPWMAKSAKVLLLFWFAIFATACQKIIEPSDKMKAIVKKAEQHYLDKITYRASVEFSCPKDKTRISQINRTKEILNLGPPTSIGSYTVLTSITMSGCGQSKRYQLDCDNNTTYVFNSPKCNYGEYCKPCAIKKVR